MKNYKIRVMTRTDGGTYNLSGDIAPDLFNSDLPDYANLETVIADMDYSLDTSGDFAGWGDVYRHDDGDLLSVTIN